jgi:hypothetical protein
MALPRDTTPAARACARDVLRQLSPAERLAIAEALSDDVRAVAEAGIRARRPGASETEVAATLARIVLGTELADAADRAMAASPR